MATYTLYPDLTKKKVGSHLSDILKRSSACSGGSKYTYKKLSINVAGEAQKRQGTGYSTDELDDEVEGSSKKSKGSAAKSSRKQKQPVSDESD